MKAVVVYFPANEKWAQMLTVLQRSWKQHTDIPLQVIEEPPPAKTSDKYKKDTNTRKLDLWINAFDQDTIFLDADMLCRSDISDAFEKIEHIGYTKRNDGTPFPLNAGVIFAKYTEYSKKFLARWREVNQEMYENPAFHKKWVDECTGMNQTALWYMLKEEEWKATELPEKYNSCTAKNWQRAYMVHIKSGTRKICFPRRRSRLRQVWDRELHDLFHAYLELPRKQAKSTIRKAAMRRTK